MREGGSWLGFCICLSPNEEAKNRVKIELNSVIKHLLLMNTKGKTKI